MPEQKEKPNTRGSLFGWATSAEVQAVRSLLFQFVQGYNVDYLSLTRQLNAHTMTFNRVEAALKRIEDKLAAIETKLPGAEDKAVLRAMTDQAAAEIQGLQTAIEQAKKP